jgi:hypothetical protein
MDLAICRKYAALLERKRQLDDDTRMLRAEIAQLEPMVMEELTNNGMTNLQVATPDGHVTLYTSSMLVARPKNGNRARVIAALKDANMGDLVAENYNSNTLSAFVRETLANEGELPTGLTDALEFDELTSVRGRRASASPESKTAKARRTLNR